jgi:hypothetical protein
MTKNLYIAIDTLNDNLSQIVITDNSEKIIFNKLIKSDALSKAINANEANRKKINDLKIKLKNTVDSVEIIDLDREIEKLNSFDTLKKYHNIFSNSLNAFDFADYANASMLDDLKDELINIIKDKNIISYDSDFLIKHLGSDILKHAKSIKSVQKRFLITQGFWNKGYDDYIILGGTGIASALSHISEKHDITPFSEKDETLEEAKGVLKIWKYLNKDHARRESRLKSDVTLNCETI